MNRSLADDIRSRSDTQLRDLLMQRPDLARPAPADLTALAARAATAPSVRRAVERLDTAHLVVLEAVVAEGGPRGRLDSPALTALLGTSVETHLDRLWALALLWRSPEGLRLVGTVPEVLGRAGSAGPAGQLRVEPPSLELSHPGQDHIDALAGARARETVRLVEDLAHAWAADPPRPLRAGGLSVRDLRRTASLVDTTSDHAAWLAELAFAADLLGQDGGEGNTVVLPTSHFDSWSKQAVAARWACLASAWLDSTRAAHLVGARSGRSGQVNALGPDAHWPPVVAARAEVLDALAALASGTGASEPSLVSLLLWRHPLRDPSGWMHVSRAVVREADWLGVVAHGALSRAGRALVERAGEATVARFADAMLPAAVDHVVLQADLTAVVPGPVEGELARFLRLVSSVESRGVATVLRFTPTSVRRGLDAGLAAQDVLDTLRRSSRTPVPQPLEYLVRDVARRHGQTRVGGATAYLRSDDESALAAILADRSLGSAFLRRLAPTVLVSSATPAGLLDLLRESGYAPVRESPDGSVVVAGAPSRRARRAPRRPTHHSAPVDVRLAEAVVAALRAAPPAPPPGATDLPRDVDPAVTLSTLREAADVGSRAWIGYADANGVSARHLVRVTRLDAGLVHVVDAAGRSKALPLYRVTGAVLAT